MFKVVEGTWNELRTADGVAPMQRKLFIGIKRAFFLSHVSYLYRAEKRGQVDK